MPFVQYIVMVRLGIAKDQIWRRSSAGRRGKLWNMGSEESIVLSLLRFMIRIYMECILLLSSWTLSNYGLLENERFVTTIGNKTPTQSVGYLSASQSVLFHMKLVSV